MKSNEIIQVPHSYSFVLGFYGRCPGQEASSECSEYDMNQSAFRNIVDSVFEVDGSQSGATFSWYKSNLFASDLNHFDELKCGKLYYFVISPGVGRVTIPHLFKTTSDDETQTGARVADDCDFIEPTPTPEADCCSDFQNYVTASASIVGSENLNGVKVFGFDFGGAFCYDSLELTYTPSRFNFKDADGNILGYITTTGNFKNKEVRYTTPTGVCYGGTAETQTGFNILTKR
jgi:hypothetical protein